MQIVLKILINKQKTMTNQSIVVDFNFKHSCCSNLKIACVLEQHWQRSFKFKEKRSQKYQYIFSWTSSCEMKNGASVSGN